MLHILYKYICIYIYIYIYIYIFIYIYLGSVIMQKQKVLSNEGFYSK